MQEMTLQGLVNAFNSEWGRNSLFVGVAVMLPGATKPEIIINVAENFESKSAYYVQAYNEDLTMKAVPAIKIVGYTFADSFEEIEGALAV